MSWLVEGAVWKADLGTIARKAVMAYLANKASDDGTGIWASKKTMADELCCSAQHVRNVINSFIDEGLVREVGKRSNATGFTIEYSIILGALDSLPRVACHAARESRHQSELALRGGSCKLDPLNGVEGSTGLTQTRAHASAHNAPARPLNGVDPSMVLTPLNGVEGGGQRGGPKPSLNHKKSSEANASGETPKRPPGWTPFDDDYPPDPEEQQQPQPQPPDPEPKPEPEEPQQPPPPIKAIDFAKVVFDSGLTLLMEAGGAEKPSRALIAKLRQQVGDANMLTIIRDAEAQSPSNPAAWITAAVQRCSGQRGFNRNDDFATAEQLAAEVNAEMGWSTCPDDLLIGSGSKSTH
jgi:hypothetical protein